MRRLRRKRDRRRDALSREALPTLVAITILLCAVAAVPAVFVSKSQPDLFDLVPRQPTADGHQLVAWFELERARHALKVGTPVTGATIRALGYMTRADEPARNGETVDRFLVVPETSHATHPAPRFGDQMIEVRLSEGDATTFREGQLIWVSGTLLVLPGNPNADRPLYRLSNARVQAATRADIPKYFR